MIQCFNVCFFCCLKFVLCFPKHVSLSPPHPPSVQGLVDNRTSMLWCKLRNVWELKEASFSKQREETEGETIRFLSWSCSVVPTDTWRRLGLLSVWRWWTFTCSNRWENTLKNTNQPISIIGLNGWGELIGWRCWWRVLVPPLLQLEPTYATETLSLSLHSDPDLVAFCFFGLQSCRPQELNDCRTGFLHFLTVYTLLWFYLYFLKLHVHAKN